MIQFSEYTIKKHILIAFVILGVGILIGIYLEAEKISNRLSLESFSDDLDTYSNDFYGFTVSYPILRYSVDTERAADGDNIYFIPRRATKDQATVVHVEEGNKNTYVQKLLESQGDNDPISQRNIKIGNELSAKQFLFSVTRDSSGNAAIPVGETWRGIQTIFSKNGYVFDVRQIYNGALDEIHPLLLTSIRIH